MGLLRLTKRETSPAVAEVLSFQAKHDQLLEKLKAQEILKELNSKDEIRYLIEADDDGG